MNKEFKYFVLSEFECPCCKRNKISLKLVNFLDGTRRLCGFPLVVKSGYRCKKHNQKVGGVTNSAHLKGLAVDIYCWSNLKRFKLIQALLSMGFERIGIYSHHIHADISKVLPRPTIWWGKYT